MPRLPLVALCLDVGGSSVKGGVVAVDGAVEVGPYRREIDSRGPAAPIVDALARALSELHGRAGGRDVRGVGVSMPGPFDYASGVSLMRGLGKLDALYGMSLAPAIVAGAPALAGLPWRWLNDAQAFALGELRYGAAVGVERAMFLTLGTGCGSAFAVGGRLVGSGPGVPEGGFVYPLLHEGRTVDELLSARGVMRAWHEVAAAGELGCMASSAADVGKLAEEGQPAALEALRRFGATLAVALAPVFAEFGPDVVVLGGLVSRSLPFFAPSARAAGAPPLVPAAEPDLAALRGAAAHLLEGVSPSRGAG